MKPKGYPRRSRGHVLTEKMSIQTLPRRPEMPDCKINGIAAYYTETGKGETIVLLHAGPDLSCRTA
jgi:hypothetical protein